jgi:glycopeptide antibiotics resistance protein
MFGLTFKVLWALVIAVTVTTEVIPIPLMPRIPFYSYCTAKLICFVALGYFAPLVFSRFNSLNRGILLAALSATCIESLQGLMRHGHSFHWYELVIKLALILLGVALALDARYEQMISIGPIHIPLTAQYREAQKPEG